MASKPCGWEESLDYVLVMEPSCCVHIALTIAGRATVGSRGTRQTEYDFVRIVLWPRNMAGKRLYRRITALDFVLAIR